MEDSTKNLINEDNEYFKTVAGLSASVVDWAKLNPENVDKDKIDKFLRDLMILPSIRNVSASSLKQMIVDDYIKQASLLMVNKFKERNVDFLVKRHDEDIISILENEWDKQSIKHERIEGFFINAETQEKLIKICLSW